MDFGIVTGGFVTSGLVDGRPSSVCCLADRIEGFRPETLFWGRYERLFEAKLYVRIKVKERVVLETILSF